MTTESNEQLEQNTNENGIAFGGIFASGAALISAAACCVLPLVFVSLGIGASALSFLVPYHWPLTIVAGVAIAVGWMLVLRNRSRGRVARSTIAILAVATLLLALSVAWKNYFEVPLQIWLNS
jgi:mercuric ion transport protein